MVYLLCDVTPELFTCLVSPELLSCCFTVGVTPELFTCCDVTPELFTCCDVTPELFTCCLVSPDRSVEDVSHGPDHAMSGLVPDSLSHLSESHLHYFTHWLLCMDLEAASQRSEGLRNIWCMTSSER